MSKKSVIKMQTKDPTVAFVTRSAVTEMLNNPEMFTRFVLGFVTEINKKL